MSETLIIKNGLVITVDANNKIYTDGAVVVQDGRIVDVGKTDVIAKRHKPDVVIDAKKKAVLPGFVNLHVHSGLIRGTAEDLAVWEWLKMFVDPKHKVLKPDDAYIAAKLCYAEMLRAGITCALDMYRHMDRCADAAEEVGIRAFLSPYVGGAPGFTLSIGESARARSTPPNHSTRRWTSWMMRAGQKSTRALGTGEMLKSSAGSSKPLTRAVQADT